MEDSALLSQFNLANITTLYKQVSEPHYLKYTGKYYKDNEDARKFSIGKEKPLELFDISQTEKKEFPFIKLKEEQKNGIATVHGNPTKVKRECPFRSENEKLTPFFKQGHSSKRMKSETYSELTMQGRLQQISKALLRKTWPEYNDENPFKPQLNKSTLAKYNMSNYLDIIKKPMSLSEVNKKVKDDVYDSIEDFEDDIQLIVNNAITYHGEASLFAKLGRDLLNYFYELKKHYFY